MKIQFFEAEIICLVKSTFMENEVVDDFILSLENESDTSATWHSLITSVHKTCQLIT